MAKTFGEWVRYFIEKGIANEQNAIPLVQAAELRGEIDVISEAPVPIDPNYYFRDQYGLFHVLEHPDPTLALYQKGPDGNFYQVYDPHQAEREARTVVRRQARLFDLDIDQVRLRRLAEADAWAEGRFGLSWGRGFADDATTLTDLLRNKDFNLDAWSLLQMWTGRAETVYAIGRAAGNAVKLIDFVMRGNTWSEGYDAAFKVLQQFGLHQRVGFSQFDAGAVASGDWRLQTSDEGTLPPGWRSVQVMVMSGRSVSLLGNTRTLNPQTTYTDPKQLQAWWNSLTPTEKQIEMALTATAGTTADFDHIPSNDWKFVSGWINQNSGEIVEISNKFGVSPDLVAGVLTSEMLFDYGTLDTLDSNLFGGAANIGYYWNWVDAPGYANVHGNTLFLAYRHLYDPLKDKSQHPWDVLGLPEIDPSAAEPEQIIKGEGEHKDYKPSLELFQSLATGVTPEHDPTSTIAAAAMVLRWLTDAYVENTGRDPLSLTPEDHAIIFGAYRAGIVGYSPHSDKELGYESVEAFRKALQYGLRERYQAQLALPIMEYTNEVFSPEMQADVLKQRQQQESQSRISELEREYDVAECRYIAFTAMVNALTARPDEDSILVTDLPRHGFGGRSWSGIDYFNCTHYERAYQSQIDGYRGLATSVYGEMVRLREEINRLKGN